MSYVLVLVTIFANGTYETYDSAHSTYLGCLAEKKVIETQAWIQDSDSAVKGLCYKLK